jgi:hypothetical protein
MELQVTISVSSAVSLIAVYSTVSLMPRKDVGSCLANAVRRTAEWPLVNFDSSPLFLIISVIVKNNPAAARVWFTSYRVSLFTY